ncbi:hypothetical protein [Streptomyces sp. NPDC050164]|uniref:hypothetical protein n=1 Tax=Streptomyces sp. NPDC050164 TaxID=3365605 RepID=UPI0037980DEA
MGGTQRGLQHGDDLGAPAGEVHPRGVRTAHQGVREVQGGPRCGGQPQQPLLMTRQLRVGHPDDAERRLFAQPVVATRVEDIDGAAGAAKSLGGTVVSGPPKWPVSDGSPS